MSTEGDAPATSAQVETPTATVPEGAGVAAEQSTEQQQQQKKKKANSYYYWHGHEKERAKVGDVAPMPTPVLVKKDEAAVPPRVLNEVPVTKYSWADSDTHVTVYVDTVSGADGTAAAETLDEASVTVSFAKRKCDVAFVTRGGAAAAVVQRRRRLVLPLANTIDAKASSYKLRMPAGRLVLRLTKATPGTWFDLVREKAHGAAANDDDDDSASSSSDNDGDAHDKRTATETTSGAAAAATSTAADDGREQQATAAAAAVDDDTTTTTNDAT